MPEPIPDDLFAQTVRQHLMATEAQLESARIFQTDSARKGQPVCLADALVKLGVITLAQRDTVEQRLLAQQKTGLARLLHYKLVRKIGEGAMGAVYLAEDERAGRQVALKVLPRSTAARPGFVERFQREADAAGRLNHPNIVRAFSFGEDQGWHFFVMEYCDGETQDRRLKRDGFIPPDEATAIILQVARALQYAHARGVVHRDVKPSNIILTPDGTAKILDLGLSKNLHDEKAAFLTQSGMTVGTPHYMAPEQARGDRDVDGRADIYSLGATYYHFVTGDTPFHGSSAFEIVTKHMTAELPDPRDLREEIPDGVVQVIRTMMAKRKEDRYADAGALAADLERVLKGEAPKARALDAGQSSVALPQVKRPPRALRPARTGVAAVSAALRGPRRSRRAGARLTAYAILGGLLLAVLIPVAFLVFGPAPPEKTPPRSAPADPGPSPAPSPPKPVPPPPNAGAPDAGGLREIRETSARRQLDDLRTLERSGTVPVRELLRRIEGFVSSYGDTRAGAEARESIARLRDEAALIGPVTDAWIQAVRRAPPAEQILRVVAKLKELNPVYDGTETHKTGTDGVTELDLSGTILRDLSPVRALAGLKALAFSQTRVEDLAPLAGLPLERLTMNRTDVSTLEPLRGMRLTHLDAYATKVADLAPLRGMPLVRLSLAGTPVSNLAPLAGAPLRELNLQYTRVEDLAPLRGMALELLRVDFTPVSDLSPVRDMPLTAFSCAGSSVADLAPLQACPLRDLGCEINSVLAHAFFRTSTTLQTINGQPAAGFWAVADALQRFLHGPPVPPDEAAWAKAVDLLPLVDPARDVYSGGWKLRDGAWISDDSTYARLELPWLPPDEYDIRVEFTRLEGKGDVNVALARGAARFACQMGAFRNVLFGFSTVGGNALSLNPTRVRLPGGLASGRRYVAVILVRKEGVKLILDGKPVAGWTESAGPLGPDTVWRTRESSGAVLGLGTYSSPAAFHRVAVRDVSGTGGPVRARSGAAAPGAGNGGAASGWTPLFDGRGLAGWESVGTPAPRVEDGALVLADGAEVQRRIANPDFELAGAVKVIRGAPVNCGSIAFRRPGTARGGTGLLFHADGDVHLFVGGDRPAKTGSGIVAAGAWHPFRLRVAGRTLELEVDGLIVLRGSIQEGPAGNLALYAVDAGAAIAFKDLRMR